MDLSTRYQIARMTSGLPEWVVILITLLVIVTVVMWVFLPFAINSLQRSALKLVKTNQEILAELKRHRSVDEVAMKALADRAVKEADKIEPKI